MTFNFVSNSVSVLNRVRIHLHIDRLPGAGGTGDRNLTDVTETARSTSSVNSTATGFRSSSTTARHVRHGPLRGAIRGQAILDFNGDVATISPSATSLNDIAVLLNNGDGTFAPAGLYPVGDPLVS